LTNPHRMLTSDVGARRPGPVSAGSPATGASEIPHLPRRLRTPPPLSPLIESVDSVTEWHVAHVKSRAEKRFAWDLVDLGVAYFLPLERVTRVSHRKSETFDRPVYPGYVFVAGDEESIDRAYRSPKLCTVIRTRNPARLLLELRNAAIGFGTSLEVLSPAVDMPVHIGKRYVVKQGHPLANQEGFVDSVTGRGRVLIAITMLGASRPTEIDAEWLEAA
jgi:hypothetical protein